MTRNRLRQWPLALGALLAGGLAACDNPACVFSANGCQVAPGGGANAVTATFPATGEWVVPLAPKIDQVYPSGFANPESPVVIVFSESISPPSLQDAFLVRPTSGLGGSGGPVSHLLVGDGRVLVLVPPALIAGTEYEIVFAEEAELRDLSGALLLRPEDGVVGTFSVDPDPDPVPELLMSWPADGTTDQSSITEIVTVFDRIIDPLSITSSSWNVLVDGLDPTFDPLPDLPTIAGPGGAQVQESRVWTWSSIDTLTGERVELGEGVTVSVELSAGLTKIQTPDENDLEEVTVSFTTAPFSPPLALGIVSEPMDAIGIENLDGTAPLMLEVEFTSPALEGDVLEIFLVGNNKPDPDDPGSEPPLISRTRELALSAGAAVVVLQDTDLSLVTSVTPLVAHFDDGDVSLAFALRRGDLRSPVRVLDVDPDTEGIQDPPMDLVRPEFQHLIGEEEGELDLITDLREISFAGVASEKPRTVEVILNLSGGAVDNRVMGQLPPLPAQGGIGSFVAAPVDVGQIDLAEFPVPVSIIVYDQALNASDPYILTLTQVGTGGSGTALPGSGLDVQVRVYDAVTLEPVESARVYSHESVDGVVTPFTTAPVDTDAAGLAAIQSAPTGETLITVERAGYDLFTFQAVPTTRLDVPLVPDLVILSAATLTVTAPGSALASNFIDNYAADSRALLPGETVRSVSDISYNTLIDQTVMLFNPPLPIRSSQVGLVTFLATKQPSIPDDPEAFTPGIFLQAFELDFPRDPVDPSSLDLISIPVGQLLSGAEVEPADIPLGTAQQMLTKPPNYALDFPNPDGEPRVSVEAFTPGIHGMMTVGLGLAYFNSFVDAWDVRAAYSARARSGGELATSLAIEDELYLRVEHVDTGGNRSGVRQALSSATGTLNPPAVPVLSAPSGTTAGEAYDLVYDNVLTGTQDEKGLYRVLLVDSVGRRWHLWTLDPPTAAGEVVQHVPPIATQGGTPLGSGAVAAFIDLWSWPSFDATDFMFSDVERRHDRFGTAAAQVFSQP